MKAAIHAGGMDTSGPDNPNWQGGQHISEHGYVRVLVPDHPKSDSKGYYYEHRLVAERHLGRVLREDEHVHHINGDKTDNSWGNLEVLEGIEHRKEHGLYNPETRDPGEGNPEIECACGCGKTLLKYDDWGRPREYITGHNVQDGPVQPRVLALLERDGPLGRQELADRLDRTPDNISGALSELRKKGEVERAGWGVWDDA